MGVNRTFKNMLLTKGGKTVRLKKIKKGAARGSKDNLVQIVLQKQKKWAPNSPNFNSQWLTKGKLIRVLNFQTSFPKTKIKLPKRWSSIFPMKILLIRCHKDSVVTGRNSGVLISKIHWVLIRILKQQWHNLCTRCCLRMRKHLSCKTK